MIGKQNSILRGRVERILRNKQLVCVKHGMGMNIFQLMPCKTKWNFISDHCHLFEYCRLVK